MKTALVLDGHIKSALTAVRTLGQDGVTVTVGAPRRTAMAVHSRYANAYFVYPSPHNNQAEFVAAVVAAATTAASNEKPVVYCFSDATYLALVAAGSEIDAVLSFPRSTDSAIEIASDKRRTYELAAECNIPTICTYTAADFPNALYPLVLKYPQSIVWRDALAIQGSAEFVFSIAKAEKRYAEILAQLGEPPLIMECIFGPEYGVELMCKNGEVIQTFIHKRIRSLSPRGGAAVVKVWASHSRETDMMLSYAATLVATLSWTGPMMVEFKIDDRDNSIKLMEINGRFWGSLPLPQRAGIDFVGGYFALAAALEWKPAASTPVQLRTRHFLGDCKWLLKVLFSHDPLRKKLYPTRVQAVYTFLKESFISEPDVWSWSDPLPAVYEILDVVKR